MCRYLKNSLHVFVSGGAIGTSFPPPRVLRRCWTTRPSLLVPLPLGQGAWAQQGRCQPSGLINQSLYIMYIALTSVSPLSCSGFASLMPACCSRPSRPAPSHLTASSFLRRRDRVLATSVANLGWWSGLHVTCCLLQAVVDLSLGLTHLQGLCHLCSQPSSLPSPSSAPNRSGSWGSLALRWAWGSH